MLFIKVSNCEILIQNTTKKLEYIFLQHTQTHTHTHKVKGASDLISLFFLSFTANIAVGIPISQVSVSLWLSTLKNSDDKYLYLSGKI